MGLRGCEERGGRGRKGEETKGMVKGGERGANFLKSKGKMGSNVLDAHRLTPTQK